MGIHVYSQVFTTTDRQNKKKRPSVFEKSCCLINCKITVFCFDIKNAIFKNKNQQSVY